MDEFSQHPSSSLSLQQLLTELENFIALESQRNGNPWISMARLSELFYEKYGISPEDLAKIQGYCNSLRNLLKSGKRFSIYSTQIPQEFYVALLHTIVPEFQQSQTTARHPIQYTIKRPWKVDGRLIEMLKAEDAEKISKYQAQKLPDPEYQPNLIPKIKSINDLEFILVELVRSLTANNPKKFVTIAVISKKFCTYYKQPIRTVIRSICPDLKLIELLQAIPRAPVQ